MKPRQILWVAMFAITVSAPSMAKKYDRSDQNQSIDISHGKIIDIERVEMKSNAAKGAQLGGLLGVASAHGKHGKDVVAGAAVGAILGALIGKASSGHKYAYAYYIQRNDARETKIVSEQDDFRVGDCVNIEEGQHTSLRRVSQSNCEAAYEDYHSGDQVVAFHAENANACAQAKDDLLNAGDDSNLEKLGYKVEVLCAH